MTELEKQRLGFSQLVMAVDALKSIVAQSQLEPMELSGAGIDGEAKDVVLPPELARHVFNAVLNTLRDACVQGSQLGLPPVEKARGSSIIIPSQEFRP